MKSAPPSKHRRQKRREESQLLDEDTMIFVGLWDFLQGMRQFEQIISPEDIVLLDELVKGQNFAVALDLVRHRLRPYHDKLPEEIAVLARPR